MRQRTYARYVVMPALLAILVLLPVRSLAQDLNAASYAAQNPVFSEYFNHPPVAIPYETGFPTGLVPEPIDLSHLTGAGSRGLQTSAILPSSYDLRAQNKLTPIRNQGGCGSCWAFATIGSLESSLMPGESCDFSENNLKDLHGFDFTCCAGGNRTMSTAYLARWAGPVAEADDYYNAGSCASPLGLTARKHVQDIVFIPDRANSLDNDGIKQAVMTYGAIYTCYYHSDSYYNSSTGGYYYTGGGANHAVCIVGWDDNFDKSNFRTTPPGNGAFIVRNSWGTYWGAAGYFYISYYDANIGKENAAFLGDSASSYDAVYQYDTYGWVSSMGYGGNTAWLANVFPAAANTNVAAASWYTSATNSSYELYVYVNPTSGPINGSGPVAGKSGTIATAGYHTIALDVPVPVTAGQKFSVVVKITTPGYSYPIALERPYSGYTSKAVASSGQSYISGNGTTWTDLATAYSNANVCLKAFTKSATGPAPANLSVTPTTTLTSTGTVGGPFTPASTAYTLKNTGTDSLNWTAGGTQPWTSLSAASGTLAAGDTTSVTVSINSAANSLVAGKYTDTVTFTNTTNGNGNTTRGVSLTVNSTGGLVVSPSNDLSSSGSVGGPFAPSSLAYTLSNTSTSSINWTAGKTQTWTSLSSAGGSIAPGASAQVAVSINSAANTLAAGTYFDTVTLTNTSNGVGSTSRQVTLAVIGASPTSDYKVVGAQYNWIDPSAQLRLLPGDNTVSAAQTIPFTFKFYGNSYNKVYVGSNGLIGFNSTYMYNYTNTDIPYAYPPNNAIFPYWDNLNPSRIGKVYIGTVGTAPNREFMVSWVGVPNFSSLSALYTFQVILCEGSNDIIFQYQNVSVTDPTYGAGKSATIGIENANGTKACKYSYNAVSLSNGQALCFTQNTVPGAPYNPWRGR